jgi:hypothetical protein
MNLHLAKYLAGTAFYQRTVYQGGGRSFRVFDRQVRVRSAARRLASTGLSDVQIARRLRRPTSFIVAMCSAVSAADALFMPKFNNREGAADVQVLQDQ